MGRAIGLQGHLAGWHAWQIHGIFRLALGAEFIGHGAFGVLTKAEWLPYFAVLQIPPPLAYQLMPVVGLVDISLGVLALLSPRRATLLYMAVWGLMTAALRPLAGEGLWEFVERAGNFGVPLAYLVLVGGGRSLRDWLAPIDVRALPSPSWSQLAWLLRLTASAVLVGHGAFGLVMHKAVWSGYFRAVGISAETVTAGGLIPVVGGLEIGLGLLVLLRPWPGLLVGVFVWKLFTECLRVIAGEPVWEVIERGGSYAAPLGLLALGRWGAAALTRVELPMAPPVSEATLTAEEALRTTGASLDGLGIGQATLTLGPDGIAVQADGLYGYRRYCWADIVGLSRAYATQRRAQPVRRWWLDPFSFTRWSVLLRVVGRLLDEQGVGPCSIEVALGGTPVACTVRVKAAGCAVITPAVLLEKQARLRLAFGARDEPPPTRSRTGAPRARCP
jgi:hypothetical protein